jgi:hypothetical protein
MEKFRLPDLTHRLTINGRNGTGKTQQGVWVLSKAHFDVQPFVIIDYKSGPDEIVNQIGRAKPIGPHEKLPKEPGLYIMHPDPRDNDRIEDWLWRVWKRGGLGLFFDEGYMLPNPHNGNGALKALMTQGRALKIPCITLSQRPVSINRFVFSEANFYSCFDLNDIRDKKTVSMFTPVHPVWDWEVDLPPFHSRWYDKAANKSVILKPVPDEAIILEDIDKRLRPKRKWI